MYLNGTCALKGPRSALEEFKRAIEKTALASGSVPVPPRGRRTPVARLPRRVLQGPRSALEEYVCPDGACALQGPRSARVCPARVSKGL
jgi:hypothetical protein